jgi:hypothetical protein
MSKFTTIKCWHVTDAVSDPAIIERDAPTLRIFKKSILKTGYRAFADGDRGEIESHPWYLDFLLGDEVRFYIDGTGFYKLVNCDLADNELYFERLNLPVGHKPWIFYSWQSDHNPSRSHIRDALTAAISHINDNLGPRQQLELVEATRPEDGADDIVKAIKSNLDRCLFAVFDITNVATVPAKSAVPGEETDQTDPNDKAKCHPNANVVFELSYAMAHKKPAQVLLLKQKRTELGEDKVPFDFEHLKRLNYDKPATLKKDIQGVLTGFLQRINYIQSEP